jgi:hypothetical protein
MVLVDVMMGRMMVMVTVEDGEIESLDTSLAKVRRREREY